jgi:signal transduction histidine kinase
MTQKRPSARINQFFRISRLLAGQLDFLSAIRAVAAEVAAIVPHDHLDVCIVQRDGKVHTAYETGIDTDWGTATHAPVAFSPIRALLTGEVGHILTSDATTDPRFQFAGAFTKPIHDHTLRSRIHLPMIVHGEVIGALSCSRHAPGLYGPADVRNARYIAEILSPYFFAIRAAEQARTASVTEAEARAREEGLRQGALRLTEALEAERQRIGMDLHDQTLADLTRLSRRVERLSQTPHPDLAPVAEGLQSAMAALRQIIDAAKPTVLHLFGFAQAVEDHLDRALRDSGQPISTVLTDDSAGLFDSLPAPVATSLLRIVQEAVNNATAHARATRLTVHLGPGPHVTVTDDGIGIDPLRKRPPGTGAGIGNMRTRARLIGARFTLGPGPGGRGTEIRVDLAPRPADTPRQEPVA